MISERMKTWTTAMLKSLWPRESTPFDVYFSNDIVTSSALFWALGWAKSFWNDETGLVLFTTGGTPTGQKIVISAGEGVCNGFGKTELEESDGFIVSARIYVDLEATKQMHIRELNRAMAHELGHVLGLEHDPNVESVMYHRTPTFPKPVLLESSKEILLSLYS